MLDALGTKVTTLLKLARNQRLFHVLVVLLLVFSVKTNSQIHRLGFHFFDPFKANHDSKSRSHLSFLARSFFQTIKKHEYYE